MELGESKLGKRAENQSYSTDKLKPNALAASQFQLAEPWLRFFRPDLFCARRKKRKGPPVVVVFS